MKNTKGLKLLSEIATKAASQMATKGSALTFYYQPRMPKSLIK